LHGGGGGSGQIKTCSCGSTGCATVGGAGSRGAVRIIWPGSTRSFPSTCTGDL
jgi:hypothetical protein